MAAVTITSESPELLDSLTDALGAEPDFKLRRLALDRLEATVEDAAEFLVEMRVRAKLARLDGPETAEGAAEPTPPSTHIRGGTVADLLHTGLTSGP